MKRILALALVALGGLTACDPERTLATIERIYDGHRIPEQAVLPPVVETPVVTIPPEEIPVPEQIGWTWDRATLTVTNHVVVPSIQVLAYHGPYQRPLMPVAILAPGQSVTIPAPACGDLMVVAVNGSVVEPDFAVC